jgi:hypothetical protein
MGAVKVFGMEKMGNQLCGDGDGDAARMQIIAIVRIKRFEAEA